MITVVFRSERTCAPCGSDHADGASISTGGSDFRFWPFSDITRRPKYVGFRTQNFPPSVLVYEFTASSYKIRLAVAARLKGETTSPPKNDCRCGSRFA